MPERLSSQRSKRYDQLGSFRLVEERSLVHGLVDLEVDGPDCRIRHNI